MRVNRIIVRSMISVLILGCWSQIAYPVDSVPAVRPLQVRSIRFEGAKAFPDERLKQILNTKEKAFRWFTDAPLDEEVLTLDLDRLEKFYRGEGYYHARVTSHRVLPLGIGKDAQIVIRVDEGPLTTVSGIDLEVAGDDAEALRAELPAILPLKSGGGFRTLGYRMCEETILQYLAARGHPKARVKMKAQLDKINNTAKVFIDVAKGPACRFGPIVIEGAKEVGEEVILRELRFKPGEPFDASKIAEGQKRLFNLRLFSFVNIDVMDIETEATELPIHILVKEAKKQTVRFGVGYGTDENFRGKAQWEIRDFLGDGRKLDIDAKASSIYQILEGNFLQPYFLGPKSSFTVVGGWMRENQTSYENSKFYASPRLQYNLTDHIVSYLGYNLEENRLLSIAEGEIASNALDKDKENYFVSSIVAGSSWDRLDDPLNPTRGFRVAESVEWASSVLGSGVDYLKLSFDARGFIPLSTYGVLAMKIKWGDIEPLESTRNIPIFKRFFSGGGDSVRGYPYQRLGPLDASGEPTGGLTLLEGNEEWRFPLPVWKDLGGVIFMDYGNVYKDSFHIPWDELRCTAGGGLRYQTPVGPISLDVGYQLNGPQQSFFSRYQVHFSIGQAF